MIANSLDQLLVKRAIVFLRALDASADLVHEIKRGIHDTRVPLLPQSYNPLLPRVIVSIHSAYDSSMVRPVSAAARARTRRPMVGKGRSIRPVAAL